VTEASSEGKAPSAPSPKVPWRRNPWFWGIIACLLFPPCIRPFTRDIVEAPAATSNPVSVELLGRTGEAFGDSNLEERIHIAVFVAAGGEECPEPVEAMRPLVERMDIQAYAGRGMLAKNAGFGEEIRVLVVAGFDGDVGEADLKTLEQRCSMDTERWVLAGGSVAQVEAIAAAVEGRSGEAPTLLTHRRIAILDTARRARGLYGMDELGLDEVYHRSRHVLRDDRIEAKDGSRAAN